MFFEAVIGQNRIREILSGAVGRDRLPHALLFHGPEGVGKDAMALELAKVINCQDPPCSGCASCRKIAAGQHPDVHLLFPVPGTIKPEELAAGIREKAGDPYSTPAFGKASSISIKALRDLQKALSYKPFEGKMKVAILAQADKMTHDAANAFLKTLEEPPPDTLLILTSSKPHTLLTTILSRCQQLRFDPLADAEIEKNLLLDFPSEPRKVRLASRLAVGNYRRAREFVKDDVSRWRDEALGLLRVGLEGNIGAVVETSEACMGRVNTDELKGVLTMALLWMRDILLLHEKREKSHIVNDDRLEELRDWAARNSDSRVRRWIEDINKTIELIDRNVNVHLTLIGLMLSWGSPGPGPGHLELQGDKP